MLTIHDCTFDVRVTGWGTLTPVAEHVAINLVLDLLNMSCDHVQRIARSPNEIIKTRRVAIANVAARLTRQDKRMPQGCDIVVEVISCPQA